MWNNTIDYIQISTIPTDLSQSMKKSMNNKYDKVFILNLELIRLTIYVVFEGKKEILEVQYK